jgi:hypothetical protein
LDDIFGDHWIHSFPFSIERREKATAETRERLTVTFAQCKVWRGKAAAKFVAVVTWW